MAPIQRAIGEHPLTAQGEAFAGELATYQNPSVVSRSLGHHVSAEAPAGLVLGIARPTTRQDGPAMIRRPRVQRKAAAETAEIADDYAETNQTPRSDAPIAAPSPEPQHRRELPSVTPLGPATQRLTTLALDESLKPVGPGRALEAQRSATPVPSPAADAEGTPDPFNEFASGNSTPARLTLGQSRRLGLGAPLRQVSTASVQRAAEALRSPDPGSPSLPSFPSIRPDSQSPATGSRTDRREMTSELPLQRTVLARNPEKLDDPEPASLTSTQGETPAIAPEAYRTEISAAARPMMQAGPAIQRITAAGDPATSSRPETELTLAPRSSTGDRGDLPAAGASPTVQRTPEHEVIEPVTAPASSAITGTAPLLGARPLQPVSVQRLSAPPPAQLEQSIQSPFMQLASRAVDRQSGQPFGESSGGSLLDPAIARSTGSPGSPGSPESPASPESPESPDSPDSPQSPASPPFPAQPTVQAYAAPAMAPFASLPLAPGLSAATAPRTSRAAAPRTSAAPAAFRQLNIAVQRQAVLSGPATAAPRSLPLAPVATVASVQRAQAATMESVQTAIAESAAPFEFGATAAGGLAASGPAFRASMTAQRADHGPPVAEAPSAGAATSSPSSADPAHAGSASSEDDMDALAGRIYERIRSRLKSELLVDRERAGLLTDLR